VSAAGKRLNNAAQVITANRLRDGVVVYLQLHGDHHHWCETIRDASILEAGDVEAMLSRISVDVFENRIVDPYAIGIGPGHVPVTQREAVRAGGPTIACRV
jgi:Protein of unknown function (DUF2849)